jgi:hypothetical protein
MCCCLKWKTEAQEIFFLIHLQFAHHANGSLPFFRLLTKKQTEVIRLQTNKTD